VPSPSLLLGQDSRPQSGELLTEAAQLRYQSPKQFRPDRNEQRYHKPDCQSHHCAGSYSAPKHLLFAGRHFNLPKARETLPHPGSTVTFLLNRARTSDCNGRGLLPAGGRWIYLDSVLDGKAGEDGKKRIVDSGRASFEAVREAAQPAGWDF
jgi:hypothetical protein